MPPGPLAERLLRWRAWEAGVDPDVVAALVGTDRGPFPTLRHPILPVALIRAALVTRRARETGTPPPAPATDGAAGGEAWASVDDHRTLASAILARLLAGLAGASPSGVERNDEERGLLAVLTGIAGGGAGSVVSGPQVRQRADALIEAHGLTELDVLRLGGYARNPVLAALRRADPLPAFTFTSPGLERHCPLGNPGDIFAVTAAHLLSGRAVSPRTPQDDPDAPLLLTVGSVLPHARDRALVWGTGLISPFAVPAEPEPTLSLLLGVRGPRTRDEAVIRWGRLPLVIGDPGLLFPEAFPGSGQDPDIEIGFVSHVRDDDDLRARFPNAFHVRVRDGLGPLAADLARCRRIIASSLHGTIFAHALGKPVAPVDVAGRLRNGDFKFGDYLASVGHYPASPRGTVDNLPAAPWFAPDPAAVARCRRLAKEGWPLAAPG